MTEEKILQFFAKYPEISYKKGEKILRPNEYSEHVYLVKSGFIRIYKVLKTGQEVAFMWYNSNLQKNVIFGYTSLMNELHIEAFTDVVLQRAPAKEFAKFIDENPDIKDRVMRDLLIYFTEALKQVEWLAIPDAYTRIKLILYTFAERAKKYQTEEEGIEQFELKLTHQLIASFAGLSRETVTIQINRLASEGRISRQGNLLIIKDLKGLVEDIH